MTNEERRELEKLAERFEVKGRRLDLMGAGGAYRNAAERLRATLDRLADEQSEPTSAKRAAELADAIMREAHESTTHPDRREIEFEPMRLHEGDLVVVDDVEYEVSEAVHGRTLDRVTLRRRDRSTEPPDSTEPEDRAHPLPWHVGDVVKAGGHLCTVTKVDAPDHLIPSYTIRPHSTALHDTGILPTERETP